MKHRKIIRSSLAFVVLCIIFYQYADNSGNNTTSVSTPGLENTSSTRTSTNHPQIEDLFNRRQSDVIVQATGEITRLLPDDNDGSRHQKFIMRLSSGHTLLVSHNIDLAPRVPSLQRRDSVIVKGEYEWTEMGGVIHWTHHDPAGRHEGGWVEHQGRRYD